MKRDRRALERAYEPDEYLCTWSVPDGADGWLSLSGSVNARVNHPPRGQLYGRAPLRSSSTTTGETTITFPQRTALTALRASLANGGTLILVDAELEYWDLRSGRVTGSAALLGKGDGLLARMRGDVEPEEQAAPLVMGARIQIAALDAVMGTAPITRVGNPSLPGAPERQWTAHGNPDSDLEWTSGGATLRVGYDGRGRVMDAYEFGLRFSPVATLRLADGMTLRELVDGYVEPLRRIIAIATGRSQDLTYLEVEVDGERGWFQVFGSAITQEPFESSTKTVTDASSTVRAHEDDLSLLDLITRWRQLESEHHPLIETYGSMLHAADQHPRSRFLLLIQALEGMHGAETREQFARRAAKHTERREAVLKVVEGLIDENLTDEDRRFIRGHLQKRPMTSLDTALTRMAEALPVNGMDALANTDLVKSLRAAGLAASTPEALRKVRNDLAHGNRGYAVAELHEVVDVLEGIVRGHGLRLLGCPDSVVARVFDRS